MCKLNILCPAMDGNCSCESSNRLKINSEKPCNSLLASILTHIRSQPEIMSVLENHNSVLNSEVSTQRSSLEGLDSPLESEHISIELLSDFHKSISVGKKFSMMLALTDRNGKNCKLDQKTEFQVFVENRKNKETRVKIANIEADSTIFVKDLSIDVDFSHADLIISCEREEIKEFRKRSLVKCKSEGLGVKKLKKD